MAFSFSTGGGGGAFGGGAIGGGGGFNVAAPQQAAVGDIGPSPATLSFHTLLKHVIKSVYHSDTFDAEELRGKFSKLKVYLRKADPLMVSPKNDARRRSLNQWLTGNQPTVNWDTDAPNPCRPGQPIPQIYPFELARQLSDDLELDELRCLELVAAAVSDQALRQELESESELGSGYLDASDSAYCAATELFYMERGALSKVLLEVVQGCHDESTLSDERRAQLRDIVQTELLDQSGGASLTEGLCDALIRITVELRKLNGMAGNAIAERRRQFLRSQRFQLSEVLFYLLHSFHVTPASAGKMVEAMRDLSLDESFFAMPALDANTKDVSDDRPGIIRAISMLQLSLAVGLDKLVSSQGPIDANLVKVMEEKLGFKHRPEDRLGFIPWEVFSTPQSDKGQQTRRAAHAHYQRQRQVKPEVHAVQGVAWLIYLVTVGRSKLRDRACYDVYRNMMEHFALWWFDKIILNLVRLDACNASDFRCRPQQMVLQPYVLTCIGNVIGSLCSMILVDNVLPLPPTLHDYKAHRVAVSEREGRDVVSVDEQDCLEELMCLCANFALVNAAEPLRQTDINNYLVLLAKESELLVSPSAPEGDHGAVYSLYAAHSHLLAALSAVCPQQLSTSRELIMDPNAYFKFWVGANRSDVRHKGVALSIGAVADELERLKFEATLPSDQCKLRTRSLLVAWTFSLSFVKHVFESNDPSLCAIIESEMFSSTSATRNDPPRLVSQLFWLCSSVTPFSTKDAEVQLPFLRGECFKVLAYWAQRGDSSLNRRDFIWRMLSASDTALLPGIASSSSSWGDASKIHVNLMRRLEDSQSRPATDGLLCLLLHALPTSPSMLANQATNGQQAALLGSSPAVGGAVGEEARALKEWLTYVKSLIEEDFKYEDEGEKYKIKARALEVLLMMLESQRQDGIFFVMSEMLSRTVLLRAVFGLLTDRVGSDAASELDEYCNTSVRLTIRKLLVVVPPVPEPHVFVNARDFETQPGVLKLQESWGWWRQRCTSMALALLEAVAVREDAFIKDWMLATKNKNTNMHMDRSSPPHCLSAWLLECADPIPVRAIAYLVGYRRNDILPVLASSLMCHLTRSRGAGSLLVEALFVHESQSHALIGHIAKALQFSCFLEGGSGDSNLTAWRPSADVDFVTESDDRHLSELARALIAQGSGPQVEAASCDVQVAVLEMLLSPLRAQTPELTLTLLGLDDRIKHRDAFHVLIDLICSFYDPNEDDQVYGTFEQLLASCTRVERCFEIMFRLLEHMKLHRLLDAVLDDIEHFLRMTGRSKLFFLVPNLGPQFARQELLSTDDVEFSEEQSVSLSRIVAWHFHIAALCLSHCCDSRSKRFPDVAGTVVNKLVNSSFGAIREWRLSGEVSASLLGGWEELLDVCFTLAPLCVPTLIGDSINFIVVKDLLNHALSALVEHPDAEMMVAEPLARGCMILASCLHSHFNLIEISPGGPIQTLDSADATNTMKLLLSAFVRRSETPAMGRTPPSHAYRGALATAIGSFLHHLTTKMTTQQVMSMAASGGGLPLNTVNMIVKASDNTCDIHIASFSVIIKHHCQDLVSTLAKYGCAESSTPKWRVSSVVLLKMVLALVREDDFVSAKVLQTLWADRHLERLLTVATKDASDDLALKYVKEAAISSLVEVSLSELGRSSLAELGAITLILRASISPSDADFMPQYVTIVNNLLQLSSQALTEDVLRFIKAHCGTMVTSLSPDKTFSSLASLRYAASISSLLSAVVGCIDQSKIEKMLEALVGAQEVRSLLGAGWTLVLKLSCFPMASNSSGSSLSSSRDTEWTNLKPSGEDEVRSSRIVTLPPPPCYNRMDGWFDFDVTKCHHWFDLLRSTSLFLRRTAHIKLAPPTNIQALTSMLEMCREVGDAFRVEAGSTTPQASSSQSSSLTTSMVLASQAGLSVTHYALMRASTNMALESLLGVLVARLEVQDGEETRMLQQAIGGGFLDKLVRSNNTNTGVVNESDFYVKKIVRFLQEQLNIEPSPTAMN